MTLGSHGIIFWCEISGRLFSNREYFMVALYAISIVRRFEYVSRQHKIAPLGSALQEKAVDELLDWLRQNLRPATEQYIAVLNKR
jgi:hypothetical protein